jgi:hypothetical protein
MTCTHTRITWPHLLSDTRISVFSYSWHYSNVQITFFLAISGFRREEGDFCALLVYYIAYGDNSVPTFRDNLSVPSSGVKKSYMNPAWTLTQRVCRNVGTELPRRCVISQKTADLNISLLAFTLNWFPGEKCVEICIARFLNVFPSKFVFLFGFHINFMDMTLADSIFWLLWAWKSSGTNASNISALLAKKLGTGESITYYCVSWNVQGVSEIHRVYLKCTGCIWNVQVYLKCTGWIWNIQGVSELYMVYMKCTGCTWNVHGVPEKYRVYLKCKGCTWNVQGLSEMYRVYLKCTRCTWNVQGVSEMYRVFLKCTEYIWNSWSNLSSPALGLDAIQNDLLYHTSSTKMVE